MPSVPTVQTTEPTMQVPLPNGDGTHALPPANGAAAPARVFWPVVGSAGPEALKDLQLTIDVQDWDIMFHAVRTRLLQSVGERLGELPDVPQHSAELSASLVQAVVLDCVEALEQLHAALRQERSQRPTA